MLFKTTYAYGLRRREVARLSFADFHANPAAKSYDRFGAIHVRYGKSVKGGSPRRRIVLTVPEFDWIVDALDQYLQDIRPRMRAGNHPALFPSERAQYLNLEHVGDRFRDAVRAAGLPDDLEMHCLRHSYATHLAEYGYDPLFIQTQLGHSYAATTRSTRTSAVNLRTGKSKRLYIASMETRHDKAHERHVAASRSNGRAG